MARTETALSVKSGEFVSVKVRDVKVRAYVAGRAVVGTKVEFLLDALHNSTFGTFHLELGASDAVCVYDDERDANTSRFQ